ncbi:hypothetical protein BOS5A_30121 [Bosea sp. EC-HK365B]|nr:hypothetical protein BOSE7B_50007 [Bosea sp. 7B]CAD5292625.1 hypothetical protein BOSE21B_90011 [Bosea sp. 21B]VVT62260.1 hypothetical protein BOS5A_30121 [Bosea sp. EC-HK365B]VXC95949.1 hypothetical protein BOSE127_90007 [Bosea sp. 127]
MVRAGRRFHGRHRAYGRAARLSAAQAHAGLHAMRLLRSLRVPMVAPTASKRAGQGTSP